MRRRWALAVALASVTALLAGAPAGAQSGKPPTRGDLARAQSAANAAAGRLARAQSALARAESEVVALEARTKDARQRLAGLEGQLRSVAVRKYVNGNVASSAWTTNGDLSAVVRGDAMLRSVTQQRADSLDAYRAARAELEESRTALSSRLGERRAAVAQLRRDSARIAAELNRLAAAHRAQEAKLAAERARQARAAARGARPAPAAAAATAVVGAAGGGWICPVNQPRAFSNDWGQPRSGGRSHQGNDILAPRGTPIVANVSGNLKPHSSSRGGISYYLAGDDGHTYFGTHLDRLSGARGRVSAGTVIGFVGNSGNASGGPPHLHFEFHPGGGRAVNPYPLLSRYC